MNGSVDLAREGVNRRKDILILLKYCQHHPDKVEIKARAEEMMKKLNTDYYVLIDYCAKFSYSFREEDVARAYPYDECVNKFRHG